MSAAHVALSELNDCPTRIFVRHLGGIFEASPWVAERVAHLRPFSGVAALHRAMCAAVQGASSDVQLGLIRAHPDLASRLAMGHESVSEQRGVGLDRLSPELFARFSALNEAYKKRFGFPFVVAVREHSVQSILLAFEERLQHDASLEQKTALQEIEKIARFRLVDLIEESQRPRMP